MYSLSRGPSTKRDAVEPKPGKGKAGAVVEADKGGKTDLLMRFFESEWFDAWIALT